MIIARLQGGLGNQLFQYAAGKSLSLRLGKPFKMEIITSLKKDRKRRLALNNFNCNFELATSREVRRFIPFPRLYRHHPPLISRMGKNIFREKAFHFDSNFFNQKDPVFLDGFWQSPSYFEGIANIIRNEFSVKSEFISTEIRAKAVELESSDSVAIHIRRGDFLNAKAVAYHGMLDSDYYIRAITLIQDKVPTSRLHYFSDDIEWVERNLYPIIKEGELVSKHTRSAIEDFHLMAHCRHNIIANSSFSWWPAWLNKYQEKIVIAPKNWFADGSIDTSDLIPPGWFRL